MIDLQSFMEEVHQSAKAHGGWDEDIPFPALIAKCHAELSAALKEYQENRPPLWFRPIYPPFRPFVDDGDCATYEKTRHKPEGIAVELADCIMLILDACAHLGINIEEALILKYAFNREAPVPPAGGKG